MKVFGVESLARVDQEPVAAVFEEKLAASTTRGDGLVVTRHHGNPGEATTTLAD